MNHFISLSHNDQENKRLYKKTKSNIKNILKWSFITIRYITIFQKKKKKKKANLISKIKNHFKEDNGLIKLFRKRN